MMDSAEPGIHVVRLACFIVTFPKIEQQIFNDVNSSCFSLIQGECSNGRNFVQQFAAMFIRFYDFQLLSLHA